MDAKEEPTFQSTRHNRHCDRASRTHASHTLELRKSRLRVYPVTWSRSLIVYNSDGPVKTHLSHTHATRRIHFVKTRKQIAVLKSSHNASINADRLRLAMHNQPHLYRGYHPECSYSNCSLNRARPHYLSMCRYQTTRCTQFRNNRS